MLKRLVMVLLLVLPGTALGAEPLTKKKVDHFIAAAEKMQELEEKYPDVDIDFDIDDQDMTEAFDMMFAEDGSLQIMRSLMNRVKDEPGVGKDMREIARSSGFSSLDEFGSVGDQLILAIARLEVSKADLAEMEQVANMPPEQLAFVPANMRPMVERMGKFSKALQAVSESDLALAREAKPRLDALDL
ncbi:hypothetical protein [Parvularcula lutaonensis]|uniref:DUF2059 domain-containing protein n=1 Tax=Parvularcula lutaonensis TaxID=491923 RepID=A0ABV7MC72_9PROT|nr:hypothetical protein [Parvularcula lutaonensis]GGY50061.1 hypothetical protein GCM10007148_18530 [Parvularcula lutaonensis]